MTPSTRQCATRTGPVVAAGTVTVSEIVTSGRRSLLSSVQGPGAGCGLARSDQDPADRRMVIETPTSSRRVMMRASPS
jgi:hypothetical protein